MKIKYRDLVKAIEVLKYKVPAEKAGGEAEITIKEENPGEGKLGECLLVTATITKNAGQYDDVKAPIIEEYSLEIFAVHENRPPRLTIVSTQDMEFKDR